MGSPSRATRGPTEAADALDHLRHLVRRELRVSDDELRACLSALKLRRLEKGDRLFEGHEAPTAAGIVTRGCLCAFFTESDGTDRVLYFAPEGWCVSGIEALAVQREVSFVVQALEASDVWVVEDGAAASGSPAVREADHIRRVMAQASLVRVHARLVGGMRKRATHRYLEFLRLYPGLDSRIPQYQVAAYVGISPEFLSKLRKRLPRVQ
jgi:CRP-like cAMP-binding protein